MTIGELKYLQPKSNDMLLKYGLDATRNNQEFEDACTGLGLNPTRIKEELIALRKVSKSISKPFNNFVKRILKNHSIVKSHVSAIRESLKLAVALETTCPHPIRSVQEKFEILAENIEVHLYKEEKLLFPEILSLWQRQTYRIQHVNSNSFPLTYPLETLEEDHASVKFLLTEIQQLFRSYKRSRNAGNQYAIVFNQIEIFEKTIHSLIDIENTILFPEALALEQELNDANITL